MAKQPTKLLTVTAKLIESKARRQAAKEEPKPPQMLLPLWPETVRGVPNTILRGALFNVSQRRPMYRKSTLLATVSGIEIRFQGESFNQTDLDVLETLLHLARQQPIGRHVEFTAHGLLKELGRSTGKTQHEQLRDEIRRLAAGLIEISWPDDAGGRLAFGGSLVKYGRHELMDGMHRYVASFDKQLLALYEAGYSYVDWEQRLALTSSLAKWLHGFFATHAMPFAYKVETIKGLCGSTVGRLGDFRKLLRTALDDMKRTGAITAWEITKDDLVKVTKNATLSQQRHIQKRTK